MRLRYGEVGKQIVIFWGDWGKSPNLRHSAPTPGIGLRRRVHRDFRTVTRCEHKTSSVCPCCEAKVHKADGQHSRLKCRREGGGCASQWWSRNVLGLTNILRGALYVLEHGREHPSFAR